MDYLDNHLLKDYKLLIDSKLIGLVEKWDESMQLENDIEKTV